jgi:tetratricopeptide (TPR) repeat protein
MTELVLPQIYSKNFLNNLHNGGYLRGVDYLDMYTSGNGFSNAKQAYERETADITFALGGNSAPSLALASAYALFLRSAGIYGEALEILEETLSRLESHLQFRSKHLDIQNVRMEMAETYRLRASYDDALDCCQTVKKQRTELFGSEHPLVLACLHTEAELLARNGSVKEAVEGFRVVLSKRELSLGKYHIATVNVMNNLGLLLHEHEPQSKEGASLIEESIVRSERLLGPNHHSTLTSINNLAYVLFDNGEVEKALSLWESTALRLQLALGDDHRLTCVVRANCASIYLKVGRHEESIRCYSEVLDYMTAALGFDHPSTLTFARLAATGFGQLGESFEKVNDLFQNCLRAQERMLGDTHTETLVTLHQYGYMLRQREKYKQAEECYRSLLQRQEKRFGKNHRDLIEILSHLGEMLAQLDLDGEEELYRRAVALAEQFDAEDGDLLGDSLWNLATYLHRQGLHLSEAEALYRRVINLREARTPNGSLDEYQDVEDVPEMLLTTLLLDQKRLQDAEPEQRKLIEICEGFLPAKDPSMCDLRYTLAWILNGLGRFSEADEVYRECIEVSRDLCGEEHEDTIALGAKLALNMQQEGKLDEARISILQLLENAKRAHGALSAAYLHVATVCASIHYRQGDSKYAIDLSSKILEAKSL